MAVWTPYVFLPRGILPLPLLKWLFELSLQSQYSLSQLATEVPAQLGAQLVPDRDDLRCIGPINLSLHRRALWACRNTPSVMWQAVYSSAVPFISRLCGVSTPASGERLGPSQACSSHAGPSANGRASKKEGLLILLWTAHSQRFLQRLISFSLASAVVPASASKHLWPTVLNMIFFKKIFLFLFWKFCKYNVLLYAMYFNHISLLHSPIQSPSKDVPNISPKRFQVLFLSVCFINVIFNPWIQLVMPLYVCIVWGYPLGHRQPIRARPLLRITICSSQQPSTTNTS